MYETEYSGQDLNAISVALSVAICVAFKAITHKGIYLFISYYWPFPGMNATMYYMKRYVVSKTKYRSYYILAVTQHQQQ